MTPSVHRKRVSISEMMKVPPRRPRACIGCRHWQVLMMALGFFCCYAIRVTTSVTLEAMTNAASANPDFEEYHWDDAAKANVLSSFFWGYICTQIPGSIIAHKWSAQKLLSIALAVCGLVTLSIPVAAHYGGWQAVCASRVIAGLCQGTVLPTLHTLLAKWSPPEERGRLATFVYSGGWIGNVICLLSSGLLAASRVGWPSCFYVWGGFTAIYGIAYYFLGKESPSEHPGIPLDEREYIEVSLGMTETTESPPTPWIKILTSIPVWALLLTQSAQNWGFWMLLTKIPSYMGAALNFNIQQNGLVSSLPYLCAWILSFPVSFLSDLVIKRNIVSIRSSRMICNTLGQWLPAAALIGLGYVGKDQPEVAVAVLVIAVSTNIIAYCGHNVNHMDLSPNFAGTLMGITNSAANVCSILAPIVASIVVKDPTDVLQWRNIFFLSAGVYIVGNLAFILFGSTKVQKWNDPVQISKTSGIFQIQELSQIESDQEKKDNEKYP